MGDDGPRLPSSEPPALTDFVVDLRMSSNISASLAAEPSARPFEWAAANRWTLVVWTGMVTWSAALIAVARNDFVNFRFGRFDLGGMVQAVWSTAHGHPLEITNFYGEEMSRLGSHVDPILVLIAPLWMLAPSPLTVAVVQILACALGALPVYWLARSHLGSDAPAALLSLAYLAYPWVAWTARDAAHPLTLAIPLFLFCVWSLDSGRMKTFALFCVLAMATGELMGVTVAALGIWYALARRKKRMGLTIAAVGLGWSLVAVFVVIPMFSDGSSVFYGYYASVGGSPQGVIRTAFTDPTALTDVLLSFRNAGYLLLLGLPLAFLFLLSPGLAAVSLPQVLASVISDNDAMTQPRHHYIGAVVPFLVVATVLALRRLPEARRASLAVAVLVLCGGFSVLAGPWPGSPGNTPTWDAGEVTPAHVHALRAAAALVPQHAAVAATNKEGSQLSTRRYVYSPLFVGRANWIVIDMQDPFIANPGFPVLEKNPEALAAFRARIEASPHWSKVFERDGVLVFQKVATSA
jgi:uncharacterized membrane protein